MTSAQDSHLTSLLTEVSTAQQETEALMRSDIHALQDRVSAVEDAVAENTKLTEGIDTDTKEILSVFRSWQGAMKALEMIGTLAKPLGYIVALFAAIAGMWAAFKTGQGPHP